MRSCFDLCLNCPLPDCDELADGCAIREGARAYRAAYRRGEEITPEQVQAWNAYCAILWERNTSKRAERSVA